MLPAPLPFCCCMGKKKAFCEGNFMHRNTKRLASALLAAALCLLLVPQAGADYEPWTYEVDDVMSTYGVEYYADVGFENPTRTADQTAADSAVSTYAADAVPFALESGVAVYAEDGTNAANVTATSDYTVTIPAEVAFASDAAEGAVQKLSIASTLQAYRKLTVAVKSTNTNKLLCNGSTSYAVPYTLQGLDEDNTVVFDSNSADVETMSKDLTLTLGSTANAAVSGDYTDTLVFTFDCVKKSTTVLIKYETMASTKNISSANVATNYPRVSVWETTTQEMMLTKGETYTFENKHKDEANASSQWENMEASFVYDGTATQCEVQFLRKMYQFDLNIALWDETEQKYKAVSAKQDDGRYDIAATDWGGTYISVNGTQRYTNPVQDYYTGHPAGSSYKLSGITINSKYKLHGYLVNVKSSNFTGYAKDAPIAITNNEMTGSMSGNDVVTPHTDGTYGSTIVWLCIEKVDNTTTTDGNDTGNTSGTGTDSTETTETTDTAAEDETTALLPDVDTVKPVVVFDGPETTPASDTTPDDLRIMDADEMLAEFALQDAQPVW